MTSQKERLLQTKIEIIQGINNQFENNDLKSVLKNEIGNEDDTEKERENMILKE